MTPFCSGWKKRKKPHLFCQTFGNQNMWKDSIEIELYEHDIENLNKTWPKILDRAQNKKYELENKNSPCFCKGSAESLRDLIIIRAIKTYYLEFHHEE
jgi:hypothetical protein